MDIGESKRITDHGLGVDALMHMHRFDDGFACTADDGAGKRATSGLCDTETQAQRSCITIWEIKYTE